MLRRTLIAGVIALFGLPAFAAPLPYTLGSDGATISYTFTIGGEKMVGTVPIASAALTIDATNLSASTAEVTADVRRARTGLIFATEALKSNSILAANDFPEARFQSTRVFLGNSGRIDDGAALEGLLTLRGVTRPVRFEAQMFRQPGTAAGDLRALNVLLTGSVNRRDFGADGYSELVDDTVQIEIKAHIETES
ncbi:MAG: YceI family protein [Tateyamaria sp.]|uniref:YceI family protein n=1 Tax=Tateyamaria sp. TaxID=1929288 RepID=UPI0032754942